MWSCVESAGGAAPCSRGKHSATLLAGGVLVLGGRGAGGAVPLRDFWRYCLASGTWQRLQCGGDVPPALQEHSATAHRGRLYVFGGEPGAPGTETPLWIYDAETQLWRKLPGQSSSAGSARRRGAREARGGGGGGGPGARRGHSAHSLRDCLLIYGGYRDLRGSTNELWAFHYESETWQQVRTAGAGPARHRHAAALHDNRLYVHGGQCDLRDCGDLWHYDTISRVWTQVRTPVKLSPSARSGHAGLRAGAHFYIFGGEANGHPTRELWRFHFGTETWERIEQGLKWPGARVDGCVLLVPTAPPGADGAGRAGDEAAARGGGGGAGAARADAGAGFLREISRLSGVHLRLTARCSYSVLAGSRDSTESLARHEAALAKSHSAFAIDARRSPREADPADGGAGPRSPAAAQLVCLDSDDEDEARRDAARRRRLPKSASVRFSRDAATVVTCGGDSDDADLSTSDYASAERVGGGGGAAVGFSNPHYLGPDVRALRAALTPDSGVAEAGAGDVELVELRRAPARRLLLLLVGGREPPHRALLQSPLAMWTYRLL